MKRISGIFFPVILFVVCLLVVSCVSVKPVQVTEVNHFKPVNVLSNPEFTFDVHVNNPNKFKVTVRRMRLSLFVGDGELISAKTPEKIKIPDYGSVTIPVSLKPSVENITEMFKNQINQLIRAKMDQKMELRGELVFGRCIFNRKVRIKKAIGF